MLLERIELSCFVFPRIDPFLICCPSKINLLSFFGQNFKKLVGFLHSVV